MEPVTTQQQQTYYQHIRSLALEYAGLDYSRALPFCLMLPEAVVQKI